MNKTYKVEGMTCGGCARSVTQAITRKAPAAKPEVDLERALVHVAGPHTQAEIQEAVEGAGFIFAGTLA